MLVKRRLLKVVNKQSFASPA